MTPFVSVKVLPSKWFNAMFAAATLLCVPLVATSTALAVMPCTRAATASPREHGASGLKIFAASLIHGYFVSLTLRRAVALSMTASC